MRRLVKDCGSFVFVAVLVLTGMELILSGHVASGPHEDISVGLTGWLDLHRYQFNWSVGKVRFVPLLIELVVATLLTWMLAKASRILRSKKSGRASPDGGTH